METFLTMLVEWTRSELDAACDPRNPGKFTARVLHVAPDDLVHLLEALILKQTPKSPKPRPQANPDRGLKRHGTDCKREQMWGYEHMGVRPEPVANSNKGAERDSQKSHARSIAGFQHDAQNVCKQPMIPKLPANGHADSRLLPITLQLGLGRASSKSKPGEEIQGRRRTRRPILVGEAYGRHRH